MQSSSVQSLNAHQPASSRSTRGMERLIEVVQELSLARDLDRIMAIVRRAARELTGADGATFVLRDGECCHYVDEDAIEPLWKGQRFPLKACISGWAMLHRQPAIIEDIYLDPRVPADAYRPTFVKSLVMVPIRTAAPVGAIGNYWAHKRCASPEEVRLLAALADSTSIAMENVQVYKTLEERVRQRTAQLAESQAALAEKHESLLRVQRQKDEMAALLVHDLKSPASGIMLSCKARLRKPDLPDSDRRYWRNIFAGAEIINRTASNLIDVARSEDGTLQAKHEDFALRVLLNDIVEAITPLAEGREQQLELEADVDIVLRGDRELLRRVLQNLLDNAFRYNASHGRVVLRAARVADAVELRVCDQGPGIPEDKRAQVFDKYARLEPSERAAATAGHGLGLTFCRAAVELHGGSIWVEANQPRGSVFAVRLPCTQRAAADGSDRSQA